MRQHHRIIFRSLFRVKIYDHNTHKIVGYAADISKNGLRMRSDVSAVEGEIYDYRIRARKNENEYVEASAKFKCVWCKKNEMTGHIESGYVLQEPNSDYFQMLDVLTLKRVALKQKNKNPD